MLRGIILLAFTLGALVFVLFFHGTGSKAARLSALMAEPAQIDALCEARREDASILESLRCNDYLAPSAGTDFYCSLIGDGLDPTVEALGQGKLRLVFEKAELDADFLASGQPLRFLAYDEERCAEGRLFLTTLPIMDIAVDDSLDVSDRTNRDAHLTLFDNRDGVAAAFRVLSTDTIIRVRGASSAAAPKKSYRLSLYTTSLGNNHRKNHRSLLGMRTDEDWILYSAGGDGERIRNTFFNNLWYQTCAGHNSLGKTLGVEGRYVELILNGQYMGLYTLMYPLDEKQVGLPEDGFYYRGFSYDNVTPEMLAKAGTADTVGGWEFRGPAGAGEGRWLCLQDYMQHLTVPDEGYLDWAAQKFDRDNILDLHLFLLLIQGQDNYYKNNNIISYPVNGDYKYLLAPWDLDLSWGNDHDNTSEWQTTAYAYAPDGMFSTLWSLPAERCLHDSAEYRAACLARWRELRAGPWSDEALNQAFDRYEAQIYGSGAMAREAERWPTSPTSENLDRFRSYGMARTAFLDGYFEEVFAQ